MPLTVSSTMWIKMHVTISVLKLLKTVEGTNGNATWSSATKPQKMWRKVGISWLIGLSYGASVDLAWGAGGWNAHALGFHVLFLCFSPCVSIIPSVWVFQEAQLWQPPDSHLDHFPLGHQKEEDTSLLAVESGACFHGVNAATRPSFKSPPPGGHQWSAGKRCCPEPGWAGGSPLQPPPTQPYCTPLCTHLQKPS